MSASTAMFCFVYGNFLSCFVFENIIFYALPILPALFRLFNYITVVVSDEG